jgi:hypothetical protein
MIPIAVLRLCGQPFGGPSDVLDQSWERMSPPSSPPPARNERSPWPALWSMIAA